jgi:hypothetical protein
MSGEIPNPRSQRPDPGPEVCFTAEGKPVARDDRRHPAALRPDLRAVDRRHADLRGHERVGRPGRARGRPDPQGQPRDRARPLVSRTYTTGREERRKLEVTVDEIGPSLRWATGSRRRSPPSQAGRRIPTRQSRPCDRPRVGAGHRPDRRFPYASNQRPPSTLGGAEPLKCLAAAAIPARERAVTCEEVFELTFLSMLARDPGGPGTS